MTMKPINFYEVVDYRNDSVWGGASALQAVEWYRRGLDHKVYVSVWDEEDGEDPKLITDKIDITSIIQATIINEKDR